MGMMSIGMGGTWNANNCQQIWLSYVIVLFFTYFGIIAGFSWKLRVTSTDCWVAQPVQKETNL
jgi:hypothetical protein